MRAQLAPARFTYVREVPSIRDEQGQQLLLATRNIQRSSGSGVSERVWVCRSLKHDQSKRSYCPSDRRRYRQCRQYALPHSQGSARSAVCNVF